MSKSTCSQAWVGAHSGNRVKSEPRQTVCQFAVSSGITSDHEVVNISHILHFLPLCLSRFALYRFKAHFFAVSEYNESLIQEISVNCLHSAKGWQDNEDETDGD